jgi:hypothetical protein
VRAKTRIMKSVAIVNKRHAFRLFAAIGFSVCHPEKTIAQCATVAVEGSAVRPFPDNIQSSGLGKKRDEHCERED